MILAAGLGTRLRELSAATPKCLLTAGGKTLLEHVILRLKAAGVAEVVINLHHLADQVEAFVRARQNFGLEVHFSSEEQLLGTGGGINKARAFLDGQECFWVHNADVYSEFDLGQLWQAHSRQPALATLAVRPCDTAQYLSLAADGRLIGWVNTSSGNQRAVPGASEAQRVTFTGVHVAEPAVFQYLQRYHAACSVFTPYLDAAAEGERIQAYSIGTAYWMDVGTPERLAQLRARIEN